MDYLLDLYTDFLICCESQATATSLSKVTEGKVSHDKITRFLHHDEFNSKHLWLGVKKDVRTHQQADACFIVDDCIVEKQYSQENDLISWHFDHSKGRSIKGINFATGFYHTCDHLGNTYCIPIAFEVVKKTVRYCEIKTKKEKRKSPITKNEMFQKMFLQAIKNQVIFRYVLADSWYGSSDNMRLIDKKDKFFIFEMKINRHAALSEKDRNIGKWSRLDQLDIPKNTPVKVWLKELDIPLLLIKQTFENKDGSEGVRYLVSNDLRLTAEQFKTLYKKRWSVEVYHKSLKQNTAIGKSQTSIVKAQVNHLFCSIIAYVKLERIKWRKQLNHFAIKSQLSIAATMKAFKQLSLMKVT